ncbi:MAG: glycosyltransferase [Oscillospiraceae bacterium]
MTAKKGRFLPPPQELSHQQGYKNSGLTNGTISVVTALYNTDKSYLAQYVESFLNQSYQYKQLCLGDASDSEHGYVGEYIKSLDSPLISYRKLEGNFGISKNTNLAFELATGDYICLCDHDDILSPDALFQMAKGIEDTGAEFLYSDEALFDTDYTNPIVGHFKPDFSYYYLTNCNYICHLACMKSSLYKELGGLCPQYDGAQDHDLFLKMTEKPNIKIHHIPKVLYYWRVHSASTSSGIGAKPYVTQNALKALACHLERLGVEGTPREGLFPSTYKIDYTLTATPLVSIIIPNMDHIDDLKKCIDSIYAKTEYTNFEVVIAENNSHCPETFDYYKALGKAHENVKIVTYEGEFNFSAINNFAISCGALGEMYLLLNNDIEIINGEWLTEMVSLALQRMWALWVGCYIIPMIRCNTPE